MRLNQGTWFETEAEGCGGRAKMKKRQKDASRQLHEDYMTGNMLQ